MKHFAPEYRPATPLRVCVLRRLVCLAAVLGASACAPETMSEAPATEERTAAAATLDLLLEEMLDGRFGGRHDPHLGVAGVALVIANDHGILYEGAAGYAQVPDEREKVGVALSAHSKMRVASVSKLAVALGAARLAAAGSLDLDADLSPVLGWSLRHPSHPQIAITARQLLSHTSTIQDPERYWVPLPGHLHELFAVGRAPFAGGAGEAAAPGERFVYANLNYGVLATALERITGERFDHLMRRTVLQALGLNDAGFNWSGVSGEARAQGATLYRRVAGRWETQTDDRATLLGEGPVFLALGDAHLDAYVPGTNGTLFSPQGGLRASVADLAVLVRGLDGDAALRADLATPVWTFDSEAPNGITDDGFFLAFGSGVHVVTQFAGDWDGRTLLGHAGEAYGLIAGAWRVADSEFSLAYAVTGTAGDVPIAREPGIGFSPWAAALIRASAAFTRGRR